MLGRALKIAFWILYDHIGKLMIANLVCVVAVGIPGVAGISMIASGDPRLQIFVGVPLGVLTFGVALPLGSVGLAHMVKVLIDKRDGALGDLFAGVRLYWRRAAAMGLFYVAAATCLATSAWFYATRLGDTAPLLGYALSALAVWCLAFLALTALFAAPAVVQRKASWLATLKTAALLVLANPLLTLGLAAQIAAVTAIAVLVPPILIFLYGAIVVVIMSAAYELLAREYAAMASGSAGEAPAGARNIDDSQDDYLNRGLRDALFPWKGQ